MTAHRIRLTVLAGLAACIIPDREIRILDEDLNPNAVRILERTVITDQMSALCNGNKEAKEPVDLRFCPPVRDTLPSGLVRPSDGGPFCICDSGRDNRAINFFYIYAEDADLDADVARDTLYGVFLLDPDPDPEEDEPGDQVAFERYWSPCAAGEEIDAEALEGSDRTSPSEARDPPPQWRFRIDDATGKVDFCNGNGTRDALEPGLHNLQFMVTDRPFFTAPYEDDPNDGVPQCGVPDIAIGASYAVVTYVFECVDASDDDDPRSNQCDCAT